MSGAYFTTRGYKKMPSRKAGARKLSGPNPASIHFSSTSHRNHRLDWLRTVLEGDGSTSARSAAYTESYSDTECIMPHQDDHQPGPSDSEQPGHRAQDFSPHQPRAREKQPFYKKKEFIFCLVGLLFMIVGLIFFIFGMVTYYSAPQCDCQQQAETYVADDPMTTTLGP